MAAERAILELELVDVNDQQKVVISLYAGKMDGVKLYGKAYLILMEFNVVINRLVILLSLILQHAAN